MPEKKIPEILIHGLELLSDVFAQQGYCLSFVIITKRGEKDYFELAVNPHIDELSAELISENIGSDYFTLCVLQQILRIARRNCGDCPEIPHCSHYLTGLNDLEKINVMIEEIEAKYLKGIREEKQYSLKVDPPRRSCKVNGKGAK